MSTHLFDDRLDLLERASAFLTEMSPYDLKRSAERTGAEFVRGKLKGARRMVSKDRVRALEMIKKQRRYRMENLDETRRQARANTNGPSANIRFRPFRKTPTFHSLRRRQRLSIPGIKSSRRRGRWNRVGKDASTGFGSANPFKDAAVNILHKREDEPTLTKRTQESLEEAPSSIKRNLKNLARNVSGSKSFALKRKATKLARKLQLHRSSGEGSSVRLSPKQARRTQRGLAKVRKASGTATLQKWGSRVAVGAGLWHGGKKLAKVLRRRRQDKEDKAYYSNPAYTD